MRYEAQRSEIKQRPLQKKRAMILHCLTLAERNLYRKQTHKQQRIADARKEALQDPKRPSVALGNQPVRPSDVNELTDNMLFEEFVRNNTFIRDPYLQGKSAPPH
jgi:hypothetical protein